MKKCYEFRLGVTLEDVYPAEFLELRLIKALTRNDTHYDTY